MSERDIEGEVAVIICGLVFFGFLAISIAEAGSGFCWLIIICVFIIYLSYSNSQMNAQIAETKEATRKANLTYQKSVRDRAAKAKRAKKKRAEETKKWDLYTPQKYFDSLVASVNRSVTEESSEASFKNLTVDFNYSYYDKYPLHYLENKATNLGLNVPKRFKKHKTLSRNEAKKDEIIKLLICDDTKTWKFAIVYTKPQTRTIDKKRGHTNVPQKADTRAE